MIERYMSIIFRNQEFYKEKVEKKTHNIKLSKSDPRFVMMDLRVRAQME